MSKIKSALELAMENTSHIKTDPNAVARAEALKKAKRNSALYINGEIEELIPSETDEKETYLNGVEDTLMANLKLPGRNEDLAKLTRLESAFMLIIDKGQEDITSLFSQLKNLFAQYLDSCDQLLDTLATQYEPQLRQKEAALKQQTGQSINLTPEQDPEFIKIYQEQQTRMDTQYNEVIKQAKDQIKELL